MFRYGIEHEIALLRADGRFADPSNTRFDELQAVVDALPEDPDDYPGLRIGDVGIKHKRWYVEGYERFDEGGALVRCDPKGLEIRTRIHDSVAAAVAALRADQALLDAELGPRGLRTCAVAFHPTRTEYVIEPPLNAWEQRHRQGSPEERTAHLHMLTFGPDLNLSSAGLPDPVDVARLLTHYSPWIVPLSFSSPFRGGRPWGGLSARTAMRTGARPAALVFLDGAAGQVRSDPSLTQVARIPAEVGRIEFKACDAIGDPDLYGELLSLLTGLALAADPDGAGPLPGRATVPDAAAHRHVARVGLADDAVHAGTGALLAAAERAVADRLGDAGGDLTRLAALRERWARRHCAALDLLARHGAGEPVAGLGRTPAPVPSRVGQDQRP
ncbi:MAG: glutamate-cysteine ligase family protein [Pseudonocardiales bacterium]|nr:glutamate-cysteine ligase family protein [Pseudonocardiales bacterium]